MTESDISTQSGHVSYTFGQNEKNNGEPLLFWLKRDCITKVATGDQHTATVTKRGRVYTIGENSWGQLGLGHKDRTQRPTCVKALQGIPISHVACGRGHTLVGTDDGRMHTFGENSEGQLGLGHTEESTHPQPVAMPLKGSYQIRKLSCGSEHSAVLLSDGSLYMWGSNMDGQLGLDEATERSTTPTCVDLEYEVRDIACGYYHTALLTTDGRLYTCGESDNEQLGHDSGSYGFHQVESIAAEKLVAVSSGNGHTAAVSDNGEVFVFGDGMAGQLGLGSQSASDMLITQPTMLTSLKMHKIVALSCGDGHTAVISDAGLVFVFGDGRDGKLGRDSDGVVKKSFTPRQLPALGDNLAVSVSCGGCHTVVVACLPVSSNSKTVKSSVEDTNSTTGHVDLPKPMDDTLCSTTSTLHKEATSTDNVNVPTLESSENGDTLPTPSQSNPVAQEDNGVPQQCGIPAASESVAAAEEENGHEVIRPEDISLPASTHSLTDTVQPDSPDDCNRHVEKADPVQEAPSSEDYTSSAALPMKRELDGDELTIVSEIDFQDNVDGNESVDEGLRSSSTEDQISVTSQLSITDDETDLTEEEPETQTVDKEPRKVSSDSTKVDSVGKASIPSEEANQPDTSPVDKEAVNGDKAHPPPSRIRKLKFWKKDTPAKMPSSEQPPAPTPENKPSPAPQERRSQAASSACVLL